VTLSGSTILNDTEHRVTFATAELLVKLAIINCHFTSSSGSLNFCMKIINTTLCLKNRTDTINMT